MNALHAQREAIATVMLCIITEVRTDSSSVWNTLSISQVISPGAGARFSELSKIRKLLTPKRGSTVKENHSIPLVFLRVQFDWFLALAETTWSLDPKMCEVDYIEEGMLELDPPSPI